MVDGKSITLTTTMEVNVRPTIKTALLLAEDAQPGVAAGTRTAPGKTRKDERTAPARRRPPSASNQTVMIVNANTPGNR
jgi:hypothetical protein